MKNKKKYQTIGTVLNSNKQVLEKESK